MSNRRAAAVIAALVLAVGLAIGLLPVTVAGDTACGSAFMPTLRLAEARTLVDEVTGNGATDYVALCNDAHDARRWIAIPLVGIGGALLVTVLTRRSGASLASRSPQARR